MTSTTVERVREIITGLFDETAVDVKPDTSFVDDLHMSSDNWAEFLFALEEIVGTEVTDEEAKGFKTVQNVVDYVDRRAKSS